MTHPDQIHLWKRQIDSRKLQIKRWEKEIKDLKKLLKEHDGK